MVSPRYQDETIVKKKGVWHAAHLSVNWSFSYSSGFF